jgi:hypothetical protein
MNKPKDPGERQPVAGQLDDGPDQPPPLATADAAEGTPEAEEEERSYFRALEDHLAALRQGWLLLTPADWLVARNWRRQGVPLDLVRRTMEELYARRIERGSKRRINSLRYFARAVEAAWEEISSLTAPGRRQTAPPLDVKARLSALVAALPADLPGRAEVGVRMTGLSGNTEQVEAELAAIDREILISAESALDGPARAELTASEASTLSRLAGRLPDEEIAVARLRLRAQILRRRLGLPVLSLFSPEAHPAEPEDAIGQDQEAH